MEPKVDSFTDPSKIRLVQLTAEANISPLFCAYSKDTFGFPCFHGVVVLCENFGSINLYHCVAKRNISLAGKTQYQVVAWVVFWQSDIYGVILEGKRLILYLSIPVTFPPPLGQTKANTGKRPQALEERVPSSSNRRSYTCSLFHLNGNNSEQYELHQLFDNELEGQEEGGMCTV